MLHHDTIVRLAAEIGFDRCGVAPSHPFDANERYFRQWLSEGRNASLDYLARNLDKRFDPGRLVAGARSIVVCAVGYKNRFSDGYARDFPAKIASYALAPDYHTTIRSMLHELFARLHPIVPQLQGRVFVDSAPVLEKQWAVEAGLGWIGRQSLLVTPDLGSFVLLGELVLTEACDRYDTPFRESQCGSCRRCIDNCPTRAIGDDRTIDANRCIACHTIERQPRTPIDLDGWIFGCDACQSCCPHNRKAPYHRNPAFDPIFDPRQVDWSATDDATFRRRFGTTPLARTGAERMRRSLAANLVATHSDPAVE